jgi:DNA-binding transcriptional regulator YiaG
MNASTADSISHALKIGRALNQQSQDAAAEAFGVSVGTWRAWEGGRLIPGGQHFPALRDWLSVSGSELVSLVGKSPS